VRPAKRIRVSEAEVPAGNTENFPTRVTNSADVQGGALESQAVTEAQSETTTPAVAKKGRKATKPRKKRTAGDGDGEVAADATGGTGKRWRKKREPTPEGAELVEIVPTAVKMSELCKDVRTGKKSKREMELRNMELAELQRKKKEREESRRSETPIKQNGDHRGSSVLDDAEALQKKPQAGPRMRIVNGEIVIDTASLQVDRHADASREAGELEDVVENTLTRKINQSTYGKRTKTESWDEEMTDLFYRGLRMFGTDFMMISKMFPGRSRRQIKLKFNGEERRHPERIRDTLLGPRETIDIETYSEMTNTVYDDPRAIQQELDEEKKRIEDQHAKEKEAQEELLRNPDAGKNVIPSIEAGAGHNQKGRSRNAKTAAAFKTSGGTEEILGSIDDLPVSV
jgi:transcription factor TFIIIB component B''